LERDAGDLFAENAAVQSASMSYRKQKFRFKNTCEMAQKSD
jgi:hypothetical protein